MQRLPLSGKIHQISEVSYLANDSVESKWRYSMFEKEITFDRFIRGLLAVIGAIALVWLINRLSDVLLPFFLAWLLAYMMYPMVCFLQYRLRLHSRILSIAVAVLLILGVFVGFMLLALPPTLSELARLSKPISEFFATVLGQADISKEINTFVNQYLTEGNSVLTLVQQSSFMQAAEVLLMQAWKLIAGTFNFAVGLLGFFIILLYLFFILYDYEKISEGWPKLIPSAHRAFAVTLIHDVKKGMNAYFRGQSLIAFLVGILFSIGFSIIDFPMAIGLGLFIGLLNLVPYLQTIGFIPTILLAVLKASDTGQNLWLILLGALIVFAVVQVIQDMILTPRIMGEVTGLNPAIILLSLSVWGSLLGMIGLIIALPLTTLCLSYYRRFVIKEETEIQLKTEAE